MMRLRKTGVPHIKNLEDLEKAGILVTAGHLDSLDEISLEYMDLSNVPFNIFNNLAKIIKNQIHLLKLLVSVFLCWKIASVRTCI